MIKKKRRLTISLQIICDETIATPMSVGDRWPYFTHNTVAAGVVVVVNLYGQCKRLKEDERRDNVVII